MAKDISVNSGPQNGPINPPVNAGNVVQTALLAGGASGANQETIAALLEFLKVNKAISDMQYEQQLEDRAKKEALKERERVLQLEKIRGAEEEKAQRRAEQAGCGHRNEKLASLVRGNWQPGGRLTCICIRCAKTWRMNPQGYLQDEDGKFLETTLQPNENQIGGVK